MQNRKKIIIGAIITLETIQNVLPDGRTAASVYNSIIGDEANKRTIVFNTGASKIKKTATQFIENR